MINTTPSRYPSRSTTQKEKLYRIIDEGLFCTVAFIREGIPHQIPTGFCRYNDDLYIHGSAKSTFFDTIIRQQVSYSITLMDALVLAPTAFDHSFNYRSVIGFATAEELVQPELKRRIFNLFIERYIPGRTADVGEPTKAHLSATKIIKFPLHKVAAKVRKDGVNMKMDNDMAWCGLVPITTNYGDPVIDLQLPPEKPLPPYLQALYHGTGDTRKSTIADQHQSETITTEIKK